MPPSTEGGAQYGSGTKVLLTEDPDVRRRNVKVSSFVGGSPSSKAPEASKNQTGSSRGLSFHIKKLAWTLFTIPICRAIVFVIFAVVRQ
jgi:hypothetical protein